jgi:hypothetical protein
VLCFVSALRGPLFQRASIVNPGLNVVTITSQNFSLAQSIPPGFFWADGAIFSDPFQNVIDGYNENSVISVLKDSCSGSCNAHLKVTSGSYSMSVTSLTVSGLWLRSQLFDDKSLTGCCGADLRSK